MRNCGGLQRLRSNSLSQSLVSRREGGQVGGLHTIESLQQGGTVYAFNMYIRRISCLEELSTTTTPLAFQVRAGEKGAIVIEEYKRVKLTQRDSQLVMKLLENPPLPNEKLRKAARALLQIGS
jgi:hypothetical protein